MQIGDRDQPVEVVEVAGPLAAAGAVEETHCRPETNGIADDLEDVSRCTVPAGVDDRAEIVAKVEHL
jgi:hypothetical protein